MSMPVDISTEEATVLFKEADKSHDGKLSVMELAQYLSKKHNFPPKDAIKMFSEYDKDSSMSITLEEFVSILKKARTQRFTLIFSEVDKDHSGKISKEEFIKAFSKGPKTDLNKLTQLFNAADKDKSGHLSKEEFLAISQKY